MKERSETTFWTFRCFHLEFLELVGILLLEIFVFKSFKDTPCGHIFFFWKFCQQLWTNWFSKFVNCITLVKLYLRPTKGTILLLLQQKDWVDWFEKWLFLLTYGQYCIYDYIVGGWRLRPERVKIYADVIYGWSLTLIWQLLIFIICM